MGTETVHSFIECSNISLYVKLNNPLMGTETINSTDWNMNFHVR